MPYLADCPLQDLGHLAEAHKGPEASNNSSSNVLQHGATSLRQESMQYLRHQLRHSQFVGQSRCFLQPKLRYFASSTLLMMPEGPEVRNLVDQLQLGVGKRLVDVQFLSGRYAGKQKPDKFYDFAKTMTQASPSRPSEKTDIIQELNCKGKFIYIILDDGSKVQMPDPDFQRSIWITLGMTGHFIGKSYHDHDPRNGRWYLELLDMDNNVRSQAYYHDQRNFGTLKFSLSKTDLDEKLASLGPDMLQPTTTEQDFLDVMAKQNPDVNICKFLMNQAKIAGVGNYVLAEGLYRAMIDPFASIVELSEDQRSLLYGELKSVLLESYSGHQLKRIGGKAQDGKTSPHSDTKEFKLQCYNQKTCPKGDEVIRDTSGPHGRAIWYTKKQLFKPTEERFVVLAHHEQLVSDEKQATAPTNTESANSSWDTVNLRDQLHDDGWKDELKEAFNSSSFQNLETFLEKETAAGKLIYPPQNQIFAALNQCPLQQVKVVIVGQDPYHGDGQGHGLAFSVQHGVRPPPSLKNIFREIADDIVINEPRHGNLEHWTKQGVLLINSVLTVEKGAANSHSKQGWEDVTDHIIAKLNEGDESLVFLLWGRPAQKKAAKVDETKHTVITTSHPSPLGATKTTSPFLGSRCFSRANDALIAMKKEPIDWSVPNPKQL